MDDRTGLKGVRRIQYVGAALTIAISCLSLVGWFIGALVLASGASQWYPMAPTTALVLLALSASLLMILRGARGSRMVAIAVGAFACLIATLLLVELTTGVPVAAFRVFVALGKVPLNSNIGQMSPVTAVLLASMSIATNLFRSPRRWPRAIAMGISLVAAGIGFVLLVGYLYSEPLLYGLGFKPVALPTAVCLLALGLGLAGLGPQIWPVKLLAGRSVQSRLLRSVVPLVFLTMVVVASQQILFSKLGLTEDPLLLSMVFLGAAAFVSAVVFRSASGVGLRVDTAEAEARLARDRLAVALQAGRSGTFEWDIESSTFDWSPELEKLYGVEPGGMGSTLEAWRARVLPEDLAGAEESFDRSLHGAGLEGEWRIRRASDGEVRWLAASGTTISDHLGRPIRVVGLNVDITERKRAEEQASTASRYARSLLEASLDPLVTISPEGKITDVNRATEQATGVGRDSLIGTDFSDYFTEPDKAREGYKQVFSEGLVVDYPLAIRHKSGEVTDVLYNASVYRDENNDVIGVFAAARDVTARKHAEEQVRAASHYSRSLIEASLDPLVTISPEGKITDVNSATEQVTGVARDKLVGTDFSDYFTEPEKARNGYLQVFSEGQVLDYALAIRHKSGKVTDVLYNASVYRNVDGDVVGVFAAARDVTARKRAEEELRTASHYSRSLIEASVDPLVTISPEGKITDVNSATEQVTGVARDKLIGTDFSDYFTEPDKAREGYRQVFSEGQVVDYPLAIRHKSGKVTDVLYNASVYRDEGGNVVGVFAAARDVTARKRAEEQVRAASHYSRSLIEASLDPLVTISPEGKITDVNSATEQVTGVARDKLVGTDFSDYFTEPEKAREGYLQAFSEGRVVDYPLAIRHKSGKVIDVLYNASVYRDEDGNVVGVFAAARDVTARKRAEEQVRAASHYSRSLIEASLDPLVTISPEGKITDVNSATEQVTGISREKLIGTDFSDYFTEPEKAREGYRQVFSEGQVIDYPLVIWHVSGSVTDVLYNASVYRDEDGNVVGVFAAARDVTERRRAEEQVRKLNEDLVRRAAELESVNRELEAFNYSVSHDLRAPLRSLDGFSQVLIEDYRDSLDDEGRDYLDRIRRAANRMGQLIDDLLNLSRVTRGELHSRRFDLSKIAEDVADELRKTSEGEKTAFTIEPGMKAQGDDRLVRIVLSNMMGNAVKFSAKGKAPKVELGTTKADGGLAYYVRDNGVGFDTNYADKLFMAFQRLHSDREFAGTGIGLAMVQRIVHRHGGRVWAESELGKGSTFYFTLGD